MQVIDWTDDLSVGIKMIDSDHKKMTGLINDLFIACFAAQGPAVLESIVNELVEYTKEHFRREEDVMAKHGFPGLARQRELHEDLTRRVIEVEQSLKAGTDDALSNEVLTFLRSWWIDHIQSEDMKFGVFLRAKGLE